MAKEGKRFNFKKDTVYDALYISDIHYLLRKKVRNHMHKDLFRLLDHLRKRGVRFRKIFLVGDIIENWYFSSQRKLVRKFGRKRFNRLFDRFDALLKRITQRREHRGVVAALQRLHFALRGVRALREFGGKRLRAGVERLRGNRRREGHDDRGDGSSRQGPRRCG